MRTFTIQSPWDDYQPREFVHPADVAQLRREHAEHVDSLVQRVGRLVHLARRCGADEAEIVRTLRDQPDVAAALSSQEPS